MLRATGAVFGTAILVLSHVQPTAAAPVPWNNEPFSYTVVDQDLRDLLGELGARMGVSVRVSDAVKARVRGRLPPAPPQEFLKHLAAIYGFEWFYHGGTLWVSASSENQTKLLRLGPVEFNQLANTMQDLGVSDERWPLRNSSDAGIVMVNGPPRYVAMTEQSLTALQQRAQPTQTEGVKVFHGPGTSAS